MPCPAALHLYVVTCLTVMAVTNISQLGSVVVCHEFSRLEDDNNFQFNLNEMLFH